MITTISTFQQLGIDTHSRVLVFMPHPDDEAVFCSGLLKKLTTANIPIKLITLTSGEKSTLVFGLAPGDDLAATRRLEQKNSCEILGIRDFEVLNIPDGGLKHQEIEVKEIILAQLEVFQPTHVISLEPDGIYGHPDHIALSKFVSEVVADPTKLLYATIPNFWENHQVSPMSEKSSISPLPPQFSLILEKSEIEAKIDSLRAHHTQFNNFDDVAQQDEFFQATKLLSHEYFTYR